jgi:hypothetical protein
MGMLEIFVNCALDVEVVGELLAYAVEIGLAATPLNPMITIKYININEFA